MQEDRNETIARRCIEEFWNRGDADLADELFAEDCTFFVPSVPTTERGPAGAKKIMLGLRSGVHEFHGTIENMISQGDMVILFTSAEGIHQGKLMGAPATGKRVKMSGAITLRIVGGKIAEYRADWDTMGFMRQIGSNT